MLVPGGRLLLLDHGGSTWPPIHAAPRWRAPADRGRVGVDGRLRCVIGEPSAVRRPLGIVRYTTRRRSPDERAGSPELSVPVARDAGDAFVEVWTTGRPVHAGRRAGLAYGHDGEFAFCAGRLPPAGRYAATVRAAYLDAFHLLRELGYPYLLRMWNYIGGINEPNAEGLETYRDFCRGRAEAFDHSPLPSDRMPAGTAVGALRPGIDFYLIAWRRDGHVAVENALQIPAYSYPERYGPRSPSFARAVHLPDGGGMLVSGTASILGHETVDAGDAAAQCRTTLANLAALVDPANLARHGIEDLRGRCFLDGSLELRWSGHSLDLLAYAQERTTQAARLRTTPASAQGNILDSRLNGRSHNE